MGLVFSLYSKLQVAFWVMVLLYLGCPTCSFTASWAETPSTNQTAPPTKTKELLSKVKEGKGPKRATLKTTQTVEPVESPEAILNTILKLEWQIGPLQASPDNLKKIGLLKVFEEASERNFKVREAKGHLEDAQAQANALIESNPLLLLNPIAVNLLKQAGQSDIKAAAAKLEAVKQTVLLESSRLYNQLIQAYLSKYLAYQAIQQGKNHLSLEKQRFINGETERFGVLQTEMALLERYNQYGLADDAYYGSSLALSNQLDFSPNEILIPEEVNLTGGLGIVQPLNLISADMTLPRAQKLAMNRPDLLALAFKKEALQKMIKASIGQDKKKHEATLKDLELEIEKAKRFVTIAIQKDFAHLAHSQKALEVTRQEYALASQLVRQLEISNQAGFTSTREVLEGQMQLAKANTKLVDASLEANLAQIQLLQDIGQLTADLTPRSLNGV